MGFIRHKQQEKLISLNYKKGKAIKLSPINFPVGKDIP
jgi:hypothetical protein